MENEVKNEVADHNLHELVLKTRTEIFARATVCIVMFIDTCVTVQIVILDSWVFRWSVDFVQYRLQRCSVAKNDKNMCYVRRSTN